VCFIAVSCNRPPHHQSITPPISSTSPALSFSSTISGTSVPTSAAGAGGSASSPYRPKANRKWSELFVGPDADRDPPLPTPIHESQCCNLGPGRATRPGWRRSGWLRACSAIASTVTLPSKSLSAPRFVSHQPVAADLQSQLSWPESLPPR
jgi:hypothetical protein